MGQLEINPAGLKALGVVLGGVWHAPVDVTEVAAVQAAPAEFRGRQGGKLRLLYRTGQGAPVWLKRLIMRGLNRE